MDNDRVEVTICLCTYKRPKMLEACLQSILIQDFELPYEVVVTDNDYKKTAQFIIEKMQPAFMQKGVSLRYTVQPEQNIALARNTGIQIANGNYIAFIDDDERAEREWLSMLYKGLIRYKADGVWGPVLPVLSDSFPQWMKKSNLFMRKNYKEGDVLWQNTATSNAMLKREILFYREGPFDSMLGKTGGEDGDLFYYLYVNHSCRYVWVINAIVYEYLEIGRKKIGWHISRSYRGGCIFSRKLARYNGLWKGFWMSTLRIIPSILMATIKSLGNLNNIRYAFLSLGMNVFSNLGKLGYFLGLLIEGYKDKNV